MRIRNKINEIAAICDKYGILLLEDSCEALGSEYSEKKLGTHSTAGSYSFYYGHHISTIEGGMVVTEDSELYQVMLSLRSHGWPLTFRQMDEKLATDFPHQFIYVRADLSNVFLQNESSLVSDCT